MCHSLLPLPVGRFLSFRGPDFHFIISGMRSLYGCWEFGFSVDKVGGGNLNLFYFPSFFHDFTNIVQNVPGHASLEAIESRGAKRKNIHKRRIKLMSDMMMVARRSSLPESKAAHTFTFCTPSFCGKLFQTKSIPRIVKK